MDGNRCLIRLLNNTCAMEQAAERLLVRRIEQYQDYPLLQQASRQHLKETRRHVALIAECLERYGAFPSVVSSPIDAFASHSASDDQAMHDDSQLQMCLRDYAAELVEVIAYEALVEAAAQIGDVMTMRVGEQILREEQVRAAEISRTLPLVMAAHLAESALVTG